MKTARFKTPSTVKQTPIRTPRFDTPGTQAKVKTPKVKTTPSREIQPRKVKTPKLKTPRAMNKSLILNTPRIEKQSPKAPNRSQAAKQSSSVTNTTLMHLTTPKPKSPSVTTAAATHDSEHLFLNDCHSKELAVLKAKFHVEHERIQQSYYDELARQKLRERLDGKAGVGLLWKKQKLISRQHPIMSMKELRQKYLGLVYDLIQHQNMEWEAISQKHRLHHLCLPRTQQQRHTTYVDAMEPSRIEFPFMHMFKLHAL